MKELPTKQRGRGADLHVHLDKNPRLIGIWYRKGFEGLRVDCFYSRERGHEEGGSGWVGRVSRGRDEDVDVPMRGLFRDFGRAIHIPIESRQDGKVLLAEMVVDEWRHTWGGELGGPVGKGLAAHRVVYGWQAWVG